MLDTYYRSGNKTFEGEPTYYLGPHCQLLLGITSARNLQFLIILYFL